MGVRLVSMIASFRSGSHLECPAGRARPCLLEPAFLQGSFLVVRLHGVAKPLVELGHVGKEQGCPEGEGHALRRLVPDLLPLLGDGVEVARE